MKPRKHAACFFSLPSSYTSCTVCHTELPDNLTKRNLFHAMLSPCLPVRKSSLHISTPIMTTTFLPHLVGSTDLQFHNIPYSLYQIFFTTALFLTTPNPHNSKCVLHSYPMTAKNVHSTKCSSTLPQ